MPERFTTPVTAGLAAILSMTIAFSASPANAATKSKPRPTPKPKTAAVALSTADREMSDFVTAVMVSQAKAPGASGTSPYSWAGQKCPRCDMGPAVAQATKAARTGDGPALNYAVQGFNKTISSYQHPSGAFGGTSADDAMETMWNANQIGFAALLLKPQISKAQYDRWAKSVTGAANYLVKNKNLTWYTNGNVVLGNALTMALAARLSTGDAAAIFTTHYQNAIDFSVAPTGRWAGRGLRFTKGTSAADPDARGYFTEEGSNNGRTEIGFDPEYTLVQMEHLASIAVVTGDKDVLGYLNALYNQLETRLDKSSWLYDSSGGTRKGAPDYSSTRSVAPFDTGSLSVLANLGGRDDLKTYLVSQRKTYEQTYKRAGDRYRFAFGWATALTSLSQPGGARLGA